MFGEGALASARARSDGAASRRGRSCASRGAYDSDFWENPTADAEAHGGVGRTPDWCSGVWRDGGKVLSGSEVCGAEMNEDGRYRCDDDFGRSDVRR